MTTPLGALRELVAASQAQGERCREAFKAMQAGILGELEAVGGFATTTPEIIHGVGYCRDFELDEDGKSWSGGACRVGTEAGGRHAGKRAPHATAIGDRCFALEQAWRKEVLALADAKDRVRALVRKLAEGDPELSIALMLAREED
jgi:hypothetical protein